MQITPKIEAVSALINARRSRSYFCESFSVLNSALWAVIWELSGEELAAALLLVQLDTARDRASLGL